MGICENFEIAIEERRLGALGAEAAGNSKSIWLAARHAKLRGFRPRFGEEHASERCNHEGSRLGRDQEDVTPRAGAHAQPAADFGYAINCLWGTCVIESCAPGWGDCDHGIGNGCETDTSSDQSHCGDCYTVCSTGQRCVYGHCH